MVEALRERFYWPGIGVTVHMFVRSCTGCILKHTVNLKDHTHYPTLAHKVGEMVAIGLLGLVSKKITNFSYLLSMMDIFSCCDKSVPATLGPRARPGARDDPDG